MEIVRELMDARRAAGRRPYNVELVRKLNAGEPLTEDEAIDYVIARLIGELGEPISGTGA